MNQPSAALPHHGILSLEQKMHWRIAWISTVDHKRLGILYMLTGLFFFVVGGIEALFIRLQLAIPNNKLIAPDTFNQLFTMHGTTMLFLVVMPVMFGLANYFIPLQVGARDMAFPRLNALGYWLVPFGGILLHFSVLAGGAPAVGWFAYAPLNETPYSSQLGVDYWALALLVMGIGSVSTSINIIATVLCMRGPGMTLRRLPLFTWINFVNSFIVILAIPVLNAALVMLLIDRRLAAHFFLPSGGGSAIMWQHIFWAFGHPEVYILALPAFGIISEVIPVFSRKPIFGYEFVAGSSVAIGLLSFGVWAHHMFTVGMGRAADTFFAFSSMLIAIPTGVKVLNWSVTMLGGRIRFTTAMLFCIAFLIQFTCGGLSGISHAIVPLDWQTKNSYYLIAHFHFIAVGGIVFAVFAALYYWFPKISGRMLSERLGRWTFWLMVIGFNMTFIIQHVLGLAGMPRRVYTYPDLPGWGWMNMVSTIGAFFMAVAALVFVYNLINSMFRGAPAGDNPWNAWTLEWATTSPPPHENFHALPPIHSRRPLWDLANPDRPDPVVGPHGKVDAVTLEKNKTGVLAFILSEAGFFGVLILAFLFYNANPQPGPGPKELNLLKTGIFSLCLFASSFTIWRSEVALHREQHRMMKLWLALTILLGGIFLIGQGLEYWGLFKSGISVSSNLFSTTFFTLTGFHGIHVGIGLIVLLIVLAMALAGDFEKKKSTALEAVSFYWHFVDVVWVFVLTVVYILPRLR
ncbi:MAG TPA: cytochrome c oxidase subunit I [Chthoniobacter sp.]|jgi:cytochrome c oxidase subunit 1/cytochrome c oxidase subunit I+III